MSAYEAVYTNARRKGMSEADATTAAAKSTSGLVDMKRSKAEKKANMPMAVSGSSEEDYPYGLSLSVENDALDKLNLSDLKVGKEVTITAKGYIKSHSSNESKGGQAHKSCSIQITKMKVS